MIMMSDMVLKGDDDDDDDDDVMLVDLSNL